MKSVKHPYARAMERVGTWLAPVYHSLYFPPLVIIGAILIATVFGWQAAKTSLDHEIDNAATNRVDTAEQTLREQMTAYEQLLRGGVGLYQGSNDVTAADFKNFLTAFDLAENYPGAQSIGFAKTFTSSELPSVQAYMAAQGIADFQIRPAEPPRDEFAAILYNQPIAAKPPAVYGFDMYAEPVRKATMVRASGSGETIITPRIELTSSDNSTSRTGFNMYTPYYQTGLPAGNAAERQAALRGYMFAAFRAEKFFESIVQSTDTDAIGFYITVKNDDPTKTLYESPSYGKISQQGDAVQLTRPMELYGQTWIVRFALDPHALISEVQLDRPGGVLFFGIFSAVLIGTIVLLLLRSRARELTGQKERAVELAKDELLSLASHQLRTPATGVKQYLGMVLQGFAGDVPKMQKGLLEKAYTSNDRQLRIINEILHLAKIDAGRIVLAKQAVSLNELITDIVSEQQPDIKAAKHRLGLHLPKKPIVVYADPHMLRMAIENVLSNAIKYTEQAGKISIALRKSKSSAVVSIKDTGIGIEAGDIDTVFEQFSRLPNELSQQVGGTGIGLYLAKHLVGLHKGRIEVRSIPGKGSTFSIILPLPKRQAIRNLTDQRKLGL